jgi:hypothetical protein
MLLFFSPCTLLVDIIYGLEKAFRYEANSPSYKLRWQMEEEKENGKKVSACINFTELLIILKQVKSHFSHFSLVFIIPRRFYQHARHNFKENEESVLLSFMSTCTYVCLRRRNLRLLLSCRVILQFLMSKCFAI